MLKSIEYRLYCYLLLLFASVAGATYFFIFGHYLYGSIAVIIALLSLLRLYKYYNSYNKDILFLLNALDNGDYAFKFATTKLSKREQNLNLMMNRIKEILVRARQEVIKNEQFLSLILERVPAGIIILDSHNHVKECNKATKQLLGLSVFTHLNQLGVIDASFPELFREIREGDRNKQIKITTEREEVRISIAVSNIKILDEDLRIITLNNIGSELEAMEMESWIRLIRVMTHEIMNSISPITSLTDMLLDSYQTTSAHKVHLLRESTIDSLSTINSTARGLTDFVESYRVFSRVSNPQFSRFEVKPFIDSVINLKAAELNSGGIKAVVSYQSPDVVLNGDRSQLTQVMVNLLKNAIEAIEQRVEDNMELNETGEIRIKVSGCREEDGRCSIEFSNNGVAIPTEVLDQIFIPFFTTKSDGSGIGLSISRYIVRLHGGTLSHSYRDGWTTFTLTI